MYLAVVDEALPEALQDPTSFLDGAQEDDSTVGRDAAAVERGRERAAVRGLGLDARVATLCHRTRRVPVSC